jgi:hypothetical protein
MYNHVLEPPSYYYEETKRELKRILIYECPYISVFVIKYIYKYTWIFVSSAPVVSVFYFIFFFFIFSFLLFVG